jgi:hypothetical protein
MNLVLFCRDALCENFLPPYVKLGVSPGDCTLVQDRGKYNFCVLASRRTVYTNLDRVFTMQFLASFSPAYGLSSACIHTCALDYV